MHIGRRRKLITFLLVLALAVGMVPAAQAAGTELRVTAPKELPRAGQTFTVTVDLSGNPGFGAVQFILAYDPAALECQSADTGALLQGAVSVTNPAAPAGAAVAAAAVDGIRGDGRLATFTFTVKQETSPGFRLEDVGLWDVEGGDLSDTVTKEVKENSAPAAQQNPADGTPAGPEGPGTAQSPAGSPDLVEKEPDEIPPPVFLSFKDMAGHWAEEDVKQAVRLGILNGYPDGTFRPDANLTRAQFVTILWRQAGRPAAAGTTPFTDLSGVNEEFQAAIAWAYGRKLIDGTSATTFNPGGTLSRQATVKILFQYSGGTAGGEQMFYGVYDGTFPDSGALADWARVPVYWGVYNTLLEAGSEGGLHPAEPATRAQLARSMIRYIEKFGGDLNT